MKNKLILTSSLLALIFTGCEKEEITRSGGVQNTSNNPNTTCTPCDEFREYFKENVSFFDERIRSINQQQYVKEILMVDLGLFR